MEQNPFKIDKEPFHIPENYWDEMEKEILRTIEKKTSDMEVVHKSRLLSIQSLKKAKAIAAVMAAMIVGATLLLLLLPKSSSEPDSADYFTYAVTHVGEFDWYLLKENISENEWEDIEPFMDEALLEEWLEAEMWPIDWSDPSILQ